MLFALWKSFLRNLFRRDRVERELDSELSSYLDELTEEKIAAGMTREEARRLAQTEVGDVEQVKEQVRDVRSGSSVEILLQDVRFGLRMLKKNFGFSAVAILTLALGIGANTAIFSVLHGVLLRPLPYRASDQLVRISTNWTGFTDGGVSAPEYRDYTEQGTSFQSIGLHSSVGSMNVAFGDGEPERVPRVMVTSNLFSTLGVKAALGRTFVAEEDQQGNQRVLVLSHGLWQRRLGGDPGAIGKTVNVHGLNYTIIGVMPPQFAFPTRETEIWRPLPTNFLEQNRDIHNLRAVARCKQGVTPLEAQKEMDVIAGRLREKYPGSYPQGSGFSPRVYSLREYIVGSIRTPLFVLSVAVAFVLLIACANVVNLVLARAGAREKEFSIRAALGAGRVRLLRQALTESVLLSLLGGAFALLLAFVGVKLLIISSPPNIPRLDEVNIDAAILGFTFLLSFLTGLLVGSITAWRFWRPDARQTLNEAERDSYGTSRRKLRAAIVISEVALAAALLVGAALLIRGFLRLQDTHPGLRPQQVVTATISLLDVKYQESSTQVQFFEQLVDEIASFPGVRSVAAVNNPPFSGWVDDGSFVIEGRPLAAPGLYPVEEVRTATPGYFRTLGISVLSGREFDKRDHAQALPIAVISDSLARKYWPGENPITKRIKMGDFESDSPWATIIGIVGDVRHEGLTKEIRPILYLPMSQHPQNTMTLVIRSTNDPDSLITSLRTAIREKDARLPLYEVRTMEQAVSASVAQPRFVFRLMTLFAILALLLASIGVYGTLSYLTTQRRREIGIRLALGASHSDILKMLCRYGLVLVGAGMLLGMAAGAAISRVLASLLFGVNRFDFGTYFGVLLLICIVACAAVLIPARKAVRVDPLVVLRYE